MRRLLVLFSLAGSILAASEQPAATSEKVSPESLRVLIDALAKTDSQVWKACDIDSDGRPSRLEVVAGLAGDPVWFKKHLPDAWKAVDTDSDGAVSVAELSTLADRDQDKAFKVAERQKTVRQRLNIGMGGAPGASVSAGSHAYAFFGQQYAYIADYDIVNNNYDPVIGVLGTGTVIDVSNMAITVVRKRVKN